MFSSAFVLGLQGMGPGGVKCWDLGVWGRLEFHGSGFCSLGFWGLRFGVLVFRVLRFKVWGFGL